MLSIGDVHLYVSDFEAAMRFWAEGLGLRVVEREQSAASAYALLELPDGGANLRIFLAPPGQAGPPPIETAPAVSFDILTDEFEDVLVRLLEHGGQQLDEIEQFEGLRVVTLADPDGNRFELIEAPPEP